ncbi:MAG: lytic transglycosylase domain-containing protein [bacterium]|nr:lytic transglycosylase domain-containing protein [bacterium]
MKKGFEQFGKPQSDTGGGAEHVKKDNGITRREFLKNAGLVMGGIFGAHAAEKLVKTGSSYVDDLIEWLETGVSTENSEEVLDIEPEAIRTILNYDARRIELNPERMKQLKEYWRLRYTNPNDHGRLQEGLQKGVERMSEWDPYIHQAFQKHAIPERLRYLALAESDFNPNAKSRKGAGGPFQIMPETARGYGLFMKPLVIDERRDPVKSADAAARILKDFYARTGDWRLAVSGYNGSFVSHYADKAKAKKETITYEGFLSFLSGEITSLRDAIQQNQFRHRVRRYESKESIAKRYGVHTRQIIQEDGSKAALRVGKRVRIDIQGEDEKRNIFYRVMRGFAENVGFYPRFDAIADIVEGSDAFAKQGKTLQFRHVKTKSLDTLHTISRRHRMDAASAEELNPAILRSRATLPRGYEIRVGG